MDMTFPRQHPQKCEGEFTAENMKTNNVTNCLGIFILEPIYKLAEAKHTNLKDGNLSFKIEIE